MFEKKFLKKAKKGHSTKTGHESDYLKKITFHSSSLIIKTKARERGIVCVRVWVSVCVRVWVCVCQTERELLTKLSLLTKQIFEDDFFNFSLKNKNKAAT